LAAQKTEGQSPEAHPKKADRDDKIDKFERLYRDWHSTRGAAYDPDVPGEVIDARMIKHEAACQALLTAPAPCSWAVFQKWELLDYMLANEAESGPYIDNRLIVAVASIKEADVIRLG
jgi:hypothetical protein